MPHYVIVYIGGEKPADPEEGKRHMAKYREWLTSLGDKAVSPANPFRDTHTINPDATVTPGSITEISGYTIIETDTMEAALNIAKVCPFLESGGKLEVSELMRMKE